ncbi:acireductone dioxygenase (ARD)-like protein, putative [Leishmania panamensis]|uniref:Acireductone dioxygenase n=2 Tax=Leishmania guyanensis species complex TaxID=38579 RepID=A0A088RPI0_LEIPA|nr:acireductone dioxygenase (ARD)-like protein, putative [Leishmania panamensis]AIN98007.1 acireductone dioxygenase (ARD)-like protein, putative [Leishmania panamensis]CCM15241.1 hypothetical protein, conserved [Leishmania guyanensis]
MTECWYIPEEVADRREENRLSPNVPGSYEALSEAGIFFRHFDPKEVSDDIEGFIQPLLKKLNYHSYDVVNLSPATLGEEKFEALAEQHFMEHTHEDDEVRLILEGQGYFDVRDANDKWIRLLSKPGDCIVLPAGMYHRFTTDHSKCIKTLRIFKEAPRWIALNRGPETEEKPARKEYLARLHAPAETAVGAANSHTIFSLHYPLKLDAELTVITKRLLEQHSKKPLALMIFLTGSTDPTTGASWCPDCIPAKPQVAQRFAELQGKYGEERAIFLQLPVERAGYLGNPEYPYRKHPTLQLASVPTLLVLTPTKDAKETGDVQWYDRLEVKMRTCDIDKADVLCLE